MKCYPEAYLTGIAWKQAQRALLTAQQDAEQREPSGNAMGQACHQPAVMGSKQFVLKKETVESFLRKRDIEQSVY